ncbi:hypothetical protein [Paraburkholderia sp. EG304]|uniref:hypothetical protein n=1 Tax=Paraburkholderia sp. EG304 TaxID=3237015 RepID=UPI00397CCD45
MQRVWNAKIPRGHIALLEAAEICGSISELARRVNRYKPCSGSRITKWLDRGMPVPPAFAPFIAHVVENRVSVHRLCPEYEQGWSLLRQQLDAADAVESRTGV